MKSPIADLSFAKARRTLNIPGNLTALLLKTSPRMRVLVTILAQQQRYDLNVVQPPLRLIEPAKRGFPFPLVIERRGPNLIAVAQLAQTNKEGTTWQVIPEVVFFIGNGEWIPVSFQGSANALERLATLSSDESRITGVTLHRQREIAGYVDEWVDEIIQSAWQLEKS